jgi:hypothetical protein
VLTAKEQRQNKSTQVIPLPAPLRLLNEPRHQILVPKEPIIRPPPNRLFRNSLLTDSTLLGTLILSLQGIRQVPSVGEPESSVAESVLDEGDEFFFDGVVEDCVGC